MKRLIVMLSVLLMGWAVLANAQDRFESDVFKTSAGDLKITFIGHGSLMFTFGGKVIHVEFLPRAGGLYPVAQGGCGLTIP